MEAELAASVCTFESRREEPLGPAFLVFRDVRTQNCCSRALTGQQLGN